MFSHSESFFIALACDLLLGIVIFITNPRRPANACFLIQSVIIGSWLLTRQYAFLSTSASNAIFWGRLCSVCGALFPFAFELLRAAVAYGNQGWPRIFKSIRYWLITTVFFVALCASPFFLIYVDFPVIHTSTGNIQLPRPYYNQIGSYAGLLFLIASIFFLTRRMWKDYFGVQEQGLRRVELQFVQLGYFILIVSSLILSMLPQILRAPRLIPLLPLFTPFCALAYSLVIAYGITSHRILDVRAFMQRGLSYLVLFAYASTVFVAVWFLTKWLFGQLGFSSEVGPALLSAFAVVLLATPGSSLVQRFAARIIPPRLNFQAAVIRVDEIIQSVSSLPLLLQQFVQAVAEVADTTLVAIVTRDQDRFTPSYPKTISGLTLTLNDPLVRHLIQNNLGELATEDLERHLTDPYRRSLRDLLQSYGLDVIVAIRRRGELTGLLLLGARRGGRIYGGPGLTALRVMTDQLAVAMDNCRLYTEARRTAAYIQTLVENLTVGVVALDNTQRITVYNREAERILQVPRCDALHASDLPADISRPITATLTDHKPTRDEIVILDSGGQQQKHLLLTCLPFAAEEADALAGIEGQPPGAILVLNDRSALVRLEQQIRQSERLASLGTLAAGTAHEIKNPLVSLRVFTQLLPKRYDDPEFRASFLELVGGEIQRIEHIVNQLLNYARPVRPVLQGLQLHETIENVLRFVEPQAARSQVQLHAKLEAENDHVLGDKNMLQQVFLNLLLNAVQALSDQGGKVTVRTRVERGFPGDVSETPEPVLVAEVIDDGPGIPAEMLPHVFDPFFTTKDTGTGLGLSVTHTIVREHGGFIEVTSDFGRGTCFRVRLQIARQNAPHEEAILVG
ncbi:MAG: hypothetical protein JO295_09030 [Verrucomicrobia bacterium]|nr:hypothetical protein [Verrucomicrobiota bacterium]